MRSLTYTQKRLIAGLLLILVILTAINYFLDLGIFGRFAKLVAICAASLVVIYGMFLAPTREEMVRRKQEKKARSR